MRVDILVFLFRGDAFSFSLLSIMLAVGLFYMEFFLCYIPSNPLPGESWQATVHGVTKSRTQLKQLNMHECMFPLCPVSGELWVFFFFYHKCWALFWFPFAWNTFSHCIIQSMQVSLRLRWVSCRQHIYTSCFCIYPASLCLLVGAYNPFVFKKIHLPLR